MAETTGIGWTDSTFNPWIGCTKVGPGCDHCYAEGLMDKRWHRVSWGSGQQRQRTSVSNWRQPLLWEREHEAFALMHDRRRRVFCASLADVFDNEVPPAWRADLFALIEQTPHLDWLVLTKRIGNAGDMMFIARGGHLPMLPNVWIGATVVDQTEADRDIPKLLKVPAAVRFLSLEPMLGPIDAAPWLTAAPIEPNGSGTLTRRVDWIIAGGESGPYARPAHLEWFRSLRRQCQSAGVPFHMKQMGRIVLDSGMSSPGEHWPSATVREALPRATEEDPPFAIGLQHAKGGDSAEWPEDMRVQEFPTARTASER